MKLYELSSMFVELFEQLEEMQEQENSEELQEAWFDTLDGLEQEFECKAENIAVYIKSLLAEAKGIKAEEQALKTRREAKERQAERLKTYLLEQMKHINLRKIESAKAKISLRKNPESVVITNDEAFVDWAEQNGRTEYLKYSKPTISKTEVKKALKVNDDLPMCYLQQTESLLIK